MYSKDKIKELINSNNTAVERGILAIYKLQTNEEKNAEQTIEHNKVGFSGFDAKRLTYYAQWLLSGKHLTGEHLEIGRKKILKYAGQLTKIANKEISIN